MCDNFGGKVRRMIAQPLRVHTITTLKLEQGGCYSNGIVGLVRKPVGEVRELVDNDVSDTVAVHVSRRNKQVSRLIRCLACSTFNTRVIGNMLSVMPRRYF